MRTQSAVPGAGNTRATASSTAWNGNSEKSSNGSLALPDLDRHLAIDLRSTSIHEAAHVVIARGYDVSADARVTPTFTTDPWEEKQFVGQARFFRYNLDPQQLKMVCLAGTVAEYCDGDPDVSGMDIMDYLQLDSLSATDAAGAGEYTDEDLDHCIGLVREAWADIEAEAAQLAAEGRDLYRRQVRS